MDKDLAQLLDQFDCRQVLHVTFGSYFRPLLLAIKVGFNAKRRGLLQGA